MAGISKATASAHNAMKRHVRKAIAGLVKASKTVAGVDVSKASRAEIMELLDLVDKVGEITLRLTALEITIGAEAKPPAKPPAMPVVHNRSA